MFVTNSVNISFGSGYKQAEKEIKPILKYTKDNIMRQLIIREYFYENIDSKGFDTYFNTDRKRVFDKYVTIPLIKQQFFDYYSSANTNVDSEKSRGIKSALFDDIINKHKGKIIYIDCWGTWCAPCLSEIPYSNRLIGKYKSKDIVFVFICIDSPEDQWQLTVNKRGILGEHYWFDKDKSNQLRADYQIAGIPYYMLIDRNGQIVKEGNNLKPSQQDTDELIEKLLPEN